MTPRIWYRALIPFIIGAASASLAMVVVDSLTDDGMTTEPADSTAIDRGTPGIFESCTESPTADQPPPCGPVIPIDVPFAYKMLLRCGTEVAVADGRTWRARTPQANPEELILRATEFEADPDYATGSWTFTSGREATFRTDWGLEIEYLAGADVDSPVC